jgi:hypothetical protein
MLPARTILPSRSGSHTKLPLASPPHNAKSCALRYPSIGPALVRKSGTKGAARKRSTGDWSRSPLSPKLNRLGGGHPLGGGLLNI